MASDFPPPGPTPNYTRRVILAFCAGLVVGATAIAMCVGVVVFVAKRGTPEPSAEVSHKRAAEGNNANTKTRTSSVRGSKESEASGAESPAENAEATAQPVGPPDSIIRGGKPAVIFNAIGHPTSFKRGEPLVSQGIAGVPYETPIFPVKVKSGNGETIVYYFRDEFGEWEAFLKPNPYRDDTVGPFPCSQ